MNKRNMILTIGATLALTSVAAPITPEEAIQRLRSEAPARIKARAPMSATPTYTSVTPSGMNAAYVFNSGDNGYIILSADDIAYPVLGYSDNSKFDVNNINPELKYWLETYGRQIEWAQQNNASVAANGPKANAEWSAVAPLVKSKWDQDTPFNDDCPVSQNKKTYSGCVAVSMAQVMNYFKYPEIGEGIIRYTTQTLNKRLSLNLGQKAFDWDNMLNTYVSGQYDEAQGAAVAYLMKCCGYSVEMNYGLSASGASGMDIAPALKKYFKYDGNCRSVSRVIYSSSEWMQMVYDNLKNIGPIVINGQSPLSGGHSFVCDGYDGNGYFHINWGWSGMSDGYYALDALNPDAQGIGGMAGGFNFHQNIILGIQPPTGEPVVESPDQVLQYGNTSASISGNKIIFDAVDYENLGWGNATDHAISVVMGAIFEPIDGTSGETINVAGKLGSVDVLNITAAYSYYPAERYKPEVEIPNLGNGKYRVTLASRDAEDTSAKWIPVATPWGYINYVDLTVDGNNKTITNFPINSVKISDAKNVSELYSAKLVRLEATFTNNSDIELSNGVCPILVNKNGQRQFVGESIIVNVGANETKTIQWDSKFYQPGTESLGQVSQDTEFTLKFYNPESNLEYSGEGTKVVMKPNPGTAQFRLTGFSIPDAEFSRLEINGVYYPRIYQVEDLSAIPLLLSYSISKGYFDGGIFIGISEQDPTNPRSMIPVIDRIYTSYPFLPAGSEETLDLKLDFSQGEEGKVYFIEAKYVLNSREDYIGYISFMKGWPAGIDGITSDSDCPTEIYNLQGVKVTNPAPGQLVIVKKGGKTTKTIWK